MERELAEKAAKWWADQLHKPAKLDHGDSSPTGGMIIALATMLQTDERVEQNAEQINAFEAALADELCEQDSEWLAFGVDYHPDLILQVAAEKVGLSLGMTTLPWKTTMWITDNERIKVACGYGVQAIEI